MGGNALSFTTRRVDEYVYFSIQRRITRVLKFQGLKILTIPAYRNKSSYGDLDLLVSGKIDPEMIYEMFEPREIVKNGNVFSFDFLNFQVDLIVTPEKYLIASRDYFSYNELGNLLGRIFHKMGLKYGHKGLLYPVRNGASCEEIEVSLDTQKILDFIGLSYLDFRSGFAELVDIFDFVISSRYFNPDIYLFDNLNHRQRTRDRKRETYNRFLEYIKDEKPGFQFPEDKDYWLPLIGAFFPGFNEKLEAVKAKFAKQNKLKEKFNGDLVMEWTELKNKELGAFIGAIRAEYSTEKLLEMSPEEIKNLVLSFETN